MYYERTRQLRDTVEACETEADNKKVQTQIDKETSYIEALTYNLEMMNFGKLKKDEEQIAKYMNDATRGMQNINKICDKYGVEHIYPDARLSRKELISISYDYWDGMRALVKLNEPLPDQEEIEWVSKELGIPELLEEIADLEDDDPRTIATMKEILRRLYDRYHDTEEDRRFFEIAYNNVGASAREHTYEAYLRECGIIYESTNP